MSVKLGSLQSALFDVIISQCGPIPTLIEWDSALPDWARLKSEADAAQTIIDRHVQAA
jgi:uncharacterized protein